MDNDVSFGSQRAFSINAHDVVWMISLDVGVAMGVPADEDGHGPDTFVMFGMDAVDEDGDPAPKPMYPLTLEQTSMIMATLSHAGATAFGAAQMADAFTSAAEAVLRENGPAT